MADAAVEVLLGNLQQLLIHHTNLIKGAKDQVEKLQRDLNTFKAFLADSSKKRRKDDSYRDLVRRIRDVVYDAEDIIDAFVTQAAETRTQNYFLKIFKKPVSLHDIAKRVGAISGEVKELHDRIKVDLQSHNSRDGGAEELLEAPTIRKENVVGFEEEASTIIGYLSETTDRLDVISIIGMPGLGKTTLAAKIFDDERIQYEFPTRIWVYVSQKFTRKDVYLAILKVFTRITDELLKEDDLQLAEKVYEYLKGGKFLIVMDDVWTADNWDKIQVALPKSNNVGKVLITSRHEEVAVRANKQRPPHNLKFLTQDESWLLLRLEVFGNPECPTQLEDLGKLIANRCSGLPLAIVVIGGILAKRSCGNNSANRVAWENVSRSVGAYLNVEDPEKRMEKIIALSYDTLPYHLKACFLYLGMFPGDFEIPAWKLIRMWIAEGFIQQKEGISGEEAAENYLDELINRNLVRVDKRRPNGRVKTCRIHDMLRDFCKHEAGSDRENYLQEMKWTPEGFEHSAIEKSRRICIHSNVINFLSLKPIGPRVRSFVCFSKEDTVLPPESTSAIPAAFKLLRVLDVKPIKFEKISRDMFELMHLRYINIAMSSSLAILAPAFEKFWNIETLILETPSRTLDIRADIWKMSQLRHLKTNASASLPKPKPKPGHNDGKEGKRLQTLGTISPQSCTKEVFDRASNLKKLGIRGKLASLLDGETVSFNCLKRLISLEKLKLLNDVFPSPASEGKLHGLPSANEFPPTLKSLTLSDTFLDWSHMSVLGSLKSLEVLKLKNKAFVGATWKAEDGGFPRLEVLHIGRTDLTFWEAEHYHFPGLRCLELHNCEKLERVPIGLANIQTFQVLDLYRSSEAAATSALQIRDKQRIWRAQNLTDGEFKLSIFPPPILA